MIDRTFTNDEMLELKSIELEALKEIDRICLKNKINYSLGYGTLIGAIRHNGFIPWDDDIDVCMLRKDYDRFAEACKKDLDKKYFYQSPETDKHYIRMFSKIRVNNTIFKELAMSEHDIHHGIYIDIFPIDYVPSSSIKRKIQMLHYHFYGYGLSAKNISLSYRSGNNLRIMRFLRVLYMPFSLEWLYKRAMKIATKYNNDENATMQRCFESTYGDRDVFPRGLYKDFILHKFEDQDFMIIKNYDEYLTGVYGDYMKLPPVEKRVAHHYVTEYSGYKKQTEE